MGGILRAECWLECSSDEERLARESQLNLMGGIPLSVASNGLLKQQLTAGGKVLTGATEL